jgi:peptidoglycan hydrolase-like protein with peptidoglycan-binding domain
MATLQDVIKNNMRIDYGDIATSYLTQDQQLCKEIQQILASNKFYNYDVDGLYGKIIREALRDFKEAYALSGGDILGPTTAEFLLRLDTLKPEAGRLANTSSKKDVQSAIVRECKRQGLTLTSQIAYVLATVQHETNNTFKPVREAYWLTEDWRRRNLTRYYPYYGRGYVQLTWDYNYKKYGDVIGINLLDDPDKIMDPNIALFILVDGMSKGRFTGKKLGTYVNASQTNFVGARVVVNDHDKDRLIADYAENWQRQIASLESVPLEEVPGTELQESSDKSWKLDPIEELILKQTMSS